MVRPDIREIQDHQVCRVFRAQRDCPANKVDKEIVDHKAHQESKVYPDLLDHMDVLVDRESLVKMDGTVQTDPWAIQITHKVRGAQKEMSVFLEILVLSVPLVH